LAEHPVLGVSLGLVLGLLLGVVCPTGDGLGEWLEAVLGDAQHCVR
jgi:hypothetical protein